MQCTDYVTSRCDIVSALHLLWMQLECSLVSKTCSLHKYRFVLV